MPSIHRSETFTMMSFAQEKKVDAKDRMQEQAREAQKTKPAQAAAQLKEKLATVPTALHRFYKKGNK